MVAITTIKGSGTDDVLTVSKRGLNYITGLQGDDKYIINNIKNSWTIVDDTVKNYDDLQEAFEFLNFDVSPVYGDGGSDTVQINNVNANDLILFFDVGITGDDANLDESLCVVHKSYINSVISQIKNFNNNDKLPSKGAVEIDYHFNSENSIEHIQVSQNGVIKEIDVTKYMEEVTEKVQVVLDKYGYSTAMDMIFNSKTPINELTACYKTPMDLIIQGTTNNDNIYAEAGSDTIIFNDESGYDTLYNATNADKLVFEDVEVSFLMKNGNNLSIYYGNENENVVTLSNYYKSNIEKRLDTYTDHMGEHSMKAQTIMVEGKGKIYGTEGNDIVEGSEKADKIYGNGGNDELYGDWGNDVIYSQSQEDKTVLLAGEEGNDKLFAGAGEDVFYFGEAYDKGEGKDVIYNANSDDKLRFANIKFEDLKFAKSGNNLVITIADLNKLSDNAQSAYKNFQVTLSNYFKNEDKLDCLEFINDENSENITTASIKDTVFYVSGSGKINASDFDDIITGSKKADKITTGVGKDVITAGKGNDTITLGAGNKSLYFNNGDGNDTIYVNDSSATVNIYLKDCDSIDYIKGQGKAINDMYIERRYKDSKGKSIVETITLKNYFSYDNPDITVYDGETPQKVSEVVYTIKGNVKKGGTLEGTNADEVLLGTDKVDTILANGGNDVIKAGKGNDIIHAEGSTCTINLNELDGIDTVYANSDSKITLNYKGTEEEIRFFKSSDNNHSDLIITRGNDFSKDVIRIKDYYTGSYFQQKPSISYQFNGGDVTELLIDDLKNISSYYTENAIDLVSDYTYIEKNPCKIVAGDMKTGYTFITNGGSIINSKESKTNDTFIVNNIAKSLTFIEDSSGVNDTLQINGVNSEAGINVFFDVNANSGFSSGITTSDLFIVSSGSKTSNISVLNDCINKFMLMPSKGICINHYFDEYVTGIPSYSGLVENVKLADVNGDNAETIDMQTKVYVIANKVQEYIEDLNEQYKKGIIKQSFKSASDILRYGTKTQKNELYKIYSKTDVNKELENGYEFNSANHLIRNGINISGGSSSDKFIINNSTSNLKLYEDVTLNGGAGNDFYDINSVNNIENNSYHENAKIYNLKINDISGDDTYILGNSLYSGRGYSGINGDTSYYITDYDGIDNYFVSGSLLDKVETIIDDKSGNNTLEIKGGYTSSNMTVLFDVILDDSEKGFHIGNDLRIVYPDSTGGNFIFGDNLQGIRIKDYFSDENTGNMSIKVDNEYLSESSINEIASNIASWMSNNDYKTGDSSFGILSQSQDNIPNNGVASTLIKSYYNNVTWESSDVTIG